MSSTKEFVEGVKEISEMHEGTSTEKLLGMMLLALTKIATDIESITKSLEARGLLN